MRRWIALSVATFLALTLSSCGHANRSPNAGPDNKSSSAGHSDESSNAATSSAAPSSAAPSKYISKGFSIPLTVTVPASLKPQPTLDSRTFLTWESVLADERAVRFLQPVVVYRPGSASPQAPPKNYLTYLRGQVSHGAKFANVKTISVDGHPATMMTATTTQALDGSLGCPTINTAADKCFGLQTDLALRIAVIDVNGKTLLAWAKTNDRDVNVPIFFAEFAAMLQGLKFR
jgi:hypothetical protein